MKPWRVPGKSTAFDLSPRLGVGSDEGLRDLRRHVVVELGMSEPDRRQTRAPLPSFTMRVTLAFAMAASSMNIAVMGSDERLASKAGATEVAPACV
jgi:hypothetical protein